MEPGRNRLRPVSSHICTQSQADQISIHVATHWKVCSSMPCDAVSCVLLLVLSGKMQNHDSRVCNVQCPPTLA